MARTFRATLEISPQGRTNGKVVIAPEVVDELGLHPGDALRAVVRGTEFTGKVLGSQRNPALQVPGDVVRSLGLREGQGLRVTVIGRAG